MDNAKIFLVNASDRELTPMPASDYIDEDQLQRYLESYPDLLAGDQIDPVTPRRWLLVAREMGIPGEEDGGNTWSIDHLFLDQDGIPTFVECKRAADTRTRREVVAQMLDYAANGTAYWSIDRIRQTAAETASRRNADLDELIVDLVGDNSEEELAGFWHNVEHNLRNGYVRLLFVVDDAPQELRRLVEFLNDKMDEVQVLIIELKQYKGAGQTALVPRVLGQSQKTADRKSTRAKPRTTLSRNEFLSRCSPQGADICRQLWTTAEERGCVIIQRSKAQAIRTETPGGGYSTLLLTYIGDEPGDEYIDFYLDHQMRESPKATSWRQRLIDSGLFHARGSQTCSSQPLSTIDPAQILDLCAQLLDAGPDIVAEKVS